MTWEEMLEMDRRKLKLHIREWDTQQWLEDVLHKPTLQWYREGKLYIGYDYCYSNNASSDYLAKARTNSLQLEEYYGRRNRNHKKTCKLCNQGKENLEHFLVVCPRLQQKRDPAIMNKWIDQSTKTQTASILFKDKDYYRTGAMIRKMWLYRKDLLKPP